MYSYHLLSPSPFWIIHKSESAFDGRYPIDRNLAERCSWNRAELVLRPYSPLSMIMGVPLNGPNSLPAIIYTFSRVFP